MDILLASAKSRINYRIKTTTRDFSNTKHIRLTTYHPQQKLLFLWFNITPSLTEAKIALMRLLSLSSLPHYIAQRA